MCKADHNYIHDSGRRGEAAVVRGDRGKRVVPSGESGRHRIRRIVCRAEQRRAVKERYLGNRAIRVRSSGQNGNGGGGVKGSVVGGGSDFDRGRTVTTLD